MNTTIKQHYNPSVNIERDLGKPIQYIVTPNAELVYNDIVKQYYRGTHAFTLVGSYGTGKSSFLIALENDLNQDQDHFFFESRIGFRSKFEVIPIVGRYESIIEVFSERLLKKNKEGNISKAIINSIERYYNKVNNRGLGLAIFIDEFGKLLEYAAKNNPESELYFIQLLSELVNDSEKDLLLITTLHQGFNSYSRALTKSQQQEWDKVRGRLSEVNFNEPVEQLLYLAAKKLEVNALETPKDFEVLFSIIKESKTFPLKDYLDIDLAVKLLPFDLLSASILTLALQRYGQNQRSLFSFIDSNSHLNIENFNKISSPFFNLSNVYDYLLFNYYSHLSTKYNPDYANWAAIRSSIERIEGVFDKSITNASNIVKAIGLLQIFSNKGGKVDHSFLVNYAKLSMGIENPEETIALLEQHKVILFSSYYQKYRLFEGTDINIELAIDEAGSLIQKVGNVVDLLKRSFDFPYILAKEEFYLRGTPRFFGFHLSDKPETIEIKDDVDGYINLVFSEELSEQEVHNFSKTVSDPTLFGLYSNTKDIKTILFEIEKIKKAIEINRNDHFAVKEFIGILEHQKNILNHYIYDNIYTNNNSIRWSYKGQSINILNQKALNKTLSRISSDIFHGTPIYKNELINRTKTSSAISVARKNLINRLLNQIDIEDIGFKNNEFPPEKTIYLSLLKKTGIHKNIDGRYQLSDPSDKSFNSLIKKGNDFIDKARISRRRIGEFVNILKEKPFKLKNGFIDFWLSVFIIKNRDRIAIYENGILIPELTTNTIDLVLKKPNDYEIKTYDLSGDRLRLFNEYRSLLEQNDESNPTSTSFIETFKPFVIFYRSLNNYTRTTERVSKETIKFREAIKNATDPESVFFEDFPKAFGLIPNELAKDQLLIEEFFIKLHECIQELNGAYDRLVNRIEQFLLNRIIGKQIPFPEYKDELISRYTTIKKYQLNVQQKAIIQRINSPLDDRKSWLNSLVFSLMNKSIEQFIDEDEDRLFDNLEKKLRELDNLCEISQMNQGSNDEEIFKLEITSFVRGLEQRLIRFPKQSLNNDKKIIDSIKTKLKGKSKEFNIALLTKLLREELGDE